LKDHKDNIINWIVIIFLEYFSFIIAKFTCSKFDTNQKYFCMFKTLKPWKWIILIFLKHFFYSTKFVFLKIEEDFLTLVIRRANGFELMKIVFITHLSTFGSKVILTLKIMDFKNVTLTQAIYDLLCIMWLYCLYLDLYLENIG
jgi:hypothetical protein